MMAMRLVNLSAWVATTALAFTAVWYCVLLTTRSRTTVDETPPFFTTVAVSAIADFLDGTTVGGTQPPCQPGAKIFHLRYIAHCTPVVAIVYIL
jgi:hypothetical protein